MYLLTCLTNSYHNLERATLTDFGSTEMRASDNVDRGPVTGDGKIECDDEPPVFDEAWHPIDETLKERQERKFDSHHGDPCEYQACCDQFTELKNSVQVWWRGGKKSRCVCESFGEVHVVHVDVEDSHRGNQAGCTEG